MRALSLGYTYQPQKETVRNRSRSTALRLGLWLRVMFFLVVFLPWLFVLYKFLQIRVLQTELKELRVQREKLMAEWEKLTAEEVVREKVAPKGLFKPTAKEVIRLP